MQTPSKFESDERRVLHYLKQLEDSKEYFKEVNFIVGDSFYSKKTFVDGVKEMGKSYVGKLRSDAHFRYIYDGEQTGLKGANTKYDGKVIYDKHKFGYVITLEKCQKVYTKVVNRIFLKSEIRIVFLVNKYKKNRILFSTDVSLSALDILDYYSSRFKIEFLFRDSKMYTELEDCQSADKKY
ncbi:MAG: transposase [Candidatus Sericytochromatia bacterium]|nr:transposase [Candidatus Sericytochromatia bacterium]